MKKLLCMLTVLMFSICSASASGTCSFFAMDTYMTISAPEASEQLLDECEATIVEFAGHISVTDTGSEIYALNASGNAEVSGEVIDILEFALEMCESTDGALDITMYPVVRAWGFTTGEYRIPDEDELAVLLENVDYTAVNVDKNIITIPEGSMIDLGSVAKGYASDIIADILREDGTKSALIDLGGNIYCLGSKSDGSNWNVGLRDPMGGDYLGVVSVKDCAVVTSGCYERYFEQDGVRYGHIFDPETGYPADSGLISVTVIGKSGAMCDALSTALYVMGPDRAIEYLRTRDDVEVILVRDDGRLIITEGIAGQFTPLGAYEHFETELVK